MKLWLGILVVISFAFGVLIGDFVASHHHLLETLVCGLILHRHIVELKRP